MGKAFAGFSVAVILWLAAPVGEAHAVPGVCMLCNETGYCTVIPDPVCFGIIVLSQLQHEQNLGPDGYGPNGFVRKVADTVLGDLTRGGGMGNNNDLVKMFKTFDNDLKHGLGPNNDIRNFLGDVFGLRW